MTHIYEHETCSQCGKTVGVTVNGIVVRHTRKKGEVCPSSSKFYFAIQPTPQEPKDAYKQGVASCQPRLAALQQRVKELEAKVEEVCSDNLQRGNRISVYEQQIIDLNESLDALESQLKPVNGWEEALCMKNPCDGCPKYRENVDGENICNVDCKIGLQWITANRQAELTWRKALASQKGETK